MSLAIKFGDETDSNSISGAIYFDAVTQWNKDYSGKVTEHPIEAGASVSDHFISNNPRFRISGVISSVDFFNLTNNFTLDGTPILNANPRPTAMMVNGLQQKLRQYIPGAIAQFLPDLPFTLLNDSTELTDHKDTVENLLRDLMNGLVYNEQRQRWENRMTPSTLYEVINGAAVKPIKFLVMTQFNVTESVENGESLVMDMTFEQVRFVTLEKAEAPAPQKGTPTSRGVKEKSNKGTATTTTKSSTEIAKSGTQKEKNIDREVAEGLGR